MREERKGGARGSEGGKRKKGRGQCKSLEQPLLVMRRENQRGE